MTDPATLETATTVEERSNEAQAVAGATESRVVPAPATGCPSCASDSTMAAPSYVYILGRIEPRFPSLSVEKELAQATGRAETAGLTDRQALHGVLSERRNRYLVRKLCWVLTVEGLETYILHPHDPADWDLLVEALRPTPRAGDVDAVVGIRGPIAPPDLCNGLQVPIVLLSQIYSFDVDSLIKSIPRPEGMTEEQFTPAAEELFGRIMQMADNACGEDCCAENEKCVDERCIPCNPGQKGCGAICCLPAAEGRFQGHCCGGACCYRDGCCQGHCCFTWGAGVPETCAYWGCNFQ